MCSCSIPLTSPVTRLRTHFGNVVKAFLVGCHLGGGGGRASHHRPPRLSSFSSLLIQSVDFHSFALLRPRTHLASSATFFYCGGHLKPSKWPVVDSPSPRSRPFPHCLVVILVFRACHFSEVSRNVRPLVRSFSLQSQSYLSHCASRVTTPSARPSALKSKKTFLVNNLFTRT